MPVVKVNHYKEKRWLVSKREPLPTPGPKWSDRLLKKGTRSIRKIRNNKIEKV